MDQTLKKYEDIALSDKDLLKLVDKKASIILYPNLVHYKTIDDVLGPYKATFLLFCSKPKYGHWCLIFQLNEHTIEFFNPYGGWPDDSLEYIPLEFRKKSNQLHTTLSRLLYYSPYQLEYNEFPFQKRSPDIKTCGRWCAVRLLNRDLNIYEFKDKIDKLKRKFKVDGDELVTLLTMNVNK